MVDTHAISVLVVEDERAHVDLVLRAFQPFADRFRISVAGTLHQAVPLIENAGPQVIVADLLLPDGQATALLPLAKSRRVPVVMMTSHGNEQVAVEAIKTGALDYVVKSEFTLQDMPHIVERALREWRHILDKERFELQVYQAQKMEAIGTLAGGIAHDFNNLLMAILGNISLARMYLPPGEKVGERLEAAEKAVVMAQELSNQLLTFSRGGGPLREPRALEPILKDAATFAFSGSNVKCRLSCSTELHRVDIDRGQINQVFNNLFINALHAMPEGGVVKVQAENVAIEQALNLPLKPGDYVRVSVQDFGCGIREEHLNKIFDPYFSTKQKGSGLGLATAYSIVKKHDGWIAVQSSPGVGTCFRIYLPASQSRGTEVPPAEEKLVFGTGNILIVDDDKSVREAMGEMLAFLGYRVSYAEEGGAAIASYARAKASGKPFDAVMLDLTIPGGMGGKEAIKRLREIDPRVKAVVSSGYSNDPVVANFQEHGFDGAICKPYRILELSRVLNEVLTREEVGAGMTAIG